MAGRDVGTGALIEPKNMDKEASWSCRTDHAPDTVTHPMVGETENASHTEKLTSPSRSRRSSSVSNCRRPKTALLRPTTVRLDCGRLPQDSPHISNRSKYFREQRLSGQHCREGFDQRSQPA